MKNVVIEKTVKGLEISVVGVKTGRKIDPNSSRQLRLKELELKKLNGELRRGRPKKQSEDINLIEMLKNIEAK
jgi:hypothetical protein